MQRYAPRRAPIGPGLWPPKARKRNRRKSSWTVDEARKFLECSRNEDDSLYPLWVLSLSSCRTRMAPRGSAERQLAWPERQFT